jgi:hypothetical protein
LSKKSRTVTLGTDHIFTIKIFDRSDHQPFKPITMNSQTERESHRAELVRQNTAGENSVSKGYENRYMRQKYDKVSSNKTGNQFGVHAKADGSRLYYDDQESTNRDLGNSQNTNKGQKGNNYYYTH